MRPYLFFVLFSVLLSATGLEAGTPPEFLWVKGTGGSSDDYGNAVAVDSVGNSVQAGSFTGTGSFLGTNLVSSGVDDIYLFKLNSSGALLWARRAGGSGSDEAYAVTLDSTGNAFVAGRFTGTAAFGSTNLVSAGTHDMFLAKYDVDGNFLWARRAGGTNTDYANGVSADANGNVFVTGVFSSAANFGGVTLTNAGNKDIFIAKYDGAGNFLWARRAGSTGTDVGFNVAADRFGNAYITGWFVFTANFGGANFTALGAQDAFLAKYDSAGNFLWLRQSGGSAAYDYGYSVAVDSAGNPHVSGSFRSTANFSGSSLTSSGSADIFLAKYSTNGTFLWAQKAGAPDASAPFKANDDEGYSVAVDGQGNAILTGYINGTANFSGTSISSISADQDIFIAKYSTNGTLSWVQRAGGSGGSDYGNSIALDANGNAYLTGAFYGAATFGTNNVTSVGLRDVYATKVSTMAVAATPPIISDVTDKILNEDTASGAIPFTVSDAETPAPNLIVAASASNSTLLPASSLVLGGSGGNRTLTITPPTNLFGTATVTLTVTDSSGATNSDSFLVTVNPVNDAPTLNAFTNVAINKNSGATLVNLGGITSGAANENQVLTVTATSSNPALIPNPTVSYVSPNSTGSLSFAPLASATGTSTITVTVQDDGGIANGGSDSFSRTFLVTVNEISEPPTISLIGDQVINEDASTAPIPFVIADPDTAAINLVVAGNASNTNLVPNANIVFGGSGNNRTVTISPAPNQFGSATISIAVSDGPNTVIRSFLLTVNSVNDWPTISAITNRVTNEDTPTASIPFTVFDVETAAASLIVLATSSDTNLVPTANLVFSGTGTNRTLVVTPAANRFGSNVITISVSDGTVTTNSSFSLTVNSVNDAPTLNALGNVIFNEDTTTNVSLSGITSGASNENQLLTVTTTSSNPALIPTPVVSYVSPNTTGNLSLVPLANANGTSTITVRVQDDGDTANGGTNIFTRTFLVTVNSLNDPPTISDIGNQNLSQNGSSGPLPFTIGDAETPATSLVLSRTSSNTRLIPNANIVFGGSGGNRTVTISPASGKLGTATITISVSDGSTTTSDSFLVTVGAGNTTPTISAITNRVTNEDTPTATIPFTVGDTETAATSLIVSASSSNTNLVPNANIILGGTGSNRTLVITPATNQFGSNLITVSVSDGVLATTTSFLLTINPVNDAPIAVDDNYGVDEGGLLNRNAGDGVLVNDFDVETNLLTTILLIAPTNGTITFTANGSFAYSHNGSETTNDSFVYKDNDGTMDSSPARVSIAIMPVNDAPIANSDNYALEQGSILKRNGGVGVLANDFDAETNLLTAVLITAPVNGTLALSNNGSFTYVHNGSQTTNDSFTYKANDGALDSGLAVVSLTITSVNHAPIFAVVPTQVVDEGTTLSVTNSASDVDTADALSFSLLSGPPGASITLNGIFSWTPTEGQGPNTNIVSIRVSDDGVPSLSSTNSFSVIVREVNSAPIISPVANKTVTVGQTWFITNSASDSDIPANALTFSLVSGPQGVSLSANGILSWTPVGIQAPSTNLIVFRVTDDGMPNLSSTSSFTVVVNPLVQDSPRIEKPEFFSGSTKLSFIAQAGRPYRIEYASGTNAPWFPLANIPAPSITTNLMVNDSVYESNRIYRLVIADAPPSIDRLTRNSEGIRLYFAVELGRSYVVHSQDSLGSPWTVLTSITPPVSTNSFFYFDSRRLPQQFYRVATLDRQGAFSTIERFPTTFSFQFNGKAGTNYTVEYCYAFSTNSWSSLTNIVPTTTTNVLVLDNTAGSSHRFYRIKSN